MDPLTILVGLAAAITAFGVIWRKAIHPVVEGVKDTAAEVRGVRELLEPDDDGRTIPERLTGLEQQVAVIDERSKQLEPNGGNSLYDRVGKLEKGQENARRQHTAFTKKVTPLVETVAALAGPPRRTAPLTKEKS